MDTDLTHSAEVYSITSSVGSGYVLSNSSPVTFAMRRSVILLPGSTDGGVADSTRNAVEVVFNLLGDAQLYLGQRIGPHVLQFFTMTYDYPYPKGKTAENVRALSNDPLNHVSSDAWRLVEFLAPNFSQDLVLSHDRTVSAGTRLPIIEVLQNFSRLTFYCKSKGNLVYREMENGIAKLMTELGYSESEITISLRELYAVGIANIFVTESGRRATGIYFVSATDRKAAKYFPGFSELIDGHSGDFSFHPRSISADTGGARELHVVVNIPETLELIGPNGRRMIHHDPTVHTALSYIGTRFGGTRDNSIPAMIRKALLSGMGRHTGELLTELLESNLYEPPSIRLTSTRGWVSRVQTPVANRVMIWVESLVGSGHLSYVEGIAKELIAGGNEVLIVTGSRMTKMPDLEIAGATIIDLPGAKGNFSSGAVLTSNGISIQNDINWQSEYIRGLLRALYDFRPDCVITEFWPIRRGVYDFAMIPFIAAATSQENNPSMYCLVRDYVHMSVTNTPHANCDETTVRLLNTYFRAILVHTHQSIIQLDESFPAASSLTIPIEYVGYISGSSPRISNHPRNTVVVTSGGGWMDYCFETTTASIRAALNHHNDDNWRIFVPRDIPEQSMISLQSMAAQSSKYPNHITVERNIPRSQFSELITTASLAIVHAGNTIIEMLGAGVPSIIALPRIEKGVLKYETRDGNPFWYIADQTHMNEQLIRAIRFGNAGFITVAAPEDLADLSKVINVSLSLDGRTFSSEFLLNGARFAAEVIREGLSIQ